MSLLNTVKKFEPKKGDSFGSKFMHTLYDGFFTFLYAPNTVTKGGVHLRDGMDLKRTMVHVVIALQLCYLFGIWNAGQQHFVALGIHTGYLESLHLKLWMGLGKLIPMFVVAHVVGLGVEFYFAARKGHAIEEGFLVTGALIPLVMPPDLPLWILALATLFAVLFGKEAFGGTGMNVVNVALLARVFVFFAYPTTISGDGNVWVSSLTKNLDTNVYQAAYSWWHSLGDTLFGLFGWVKYPHIGTSVVDGFSGATPLGYAAKGGMEALSQYFTFAEIIWGAIPGSFGETCKPLIIIGAIFLVVTKIASWRVMLSMILGTLVMGLLFNAWGKTPMMDIPYYYHFFMGSFLFAMAFMATDPVTAAATNRGKWYYGFFIGVVGMMIRVINPAYPEGWMLAILFMNVWAPLIDHVVISANISKRLSRAKK